MRTVRGWAPPLLGPLPDDFLRLSPAPWGVSQKKQVSIVLLYTHDSGTMDWLSRVWVGHRQVEMRTVGSVA
jgi:hypothetical protein